MLFKDVHVLVTGGTRGIGKAISQKLLREGAQVVITGTKNRENGWWNEFENCTFSTVDFLDELAVSDFCNYIKENSFSCLVNNAGIFSNSDKTNTLTSFDSVHKVNVSAVHSVTSAFACGSFENISPRVVNISSIAAFVTREGVASYASSKASLNGLTRAHALDFAKKGILVNAICPSFTETDMLKALSMEKQNELLQLVPLGRFCNAYEIAELACFLLSDDNTYMTGQTLVIDGGVTIQ